MNKIKISLVVAIDEKGGIGKKGSVPLLWHIPEDLKRFKEITFGHVIIMGRRTFESIGLPLPNRTNIVITRDIAFNAEGVIVVNSLEEAVNVAEEKERDNENPEIFIIGGAKVFEQSMSLADKIYLTKVEGDYGADAFFPDYSQFKKIVFEQTGESNGYRFNFLDLERD